MRRKRGEGNPNWKGGRKLDSKGYVLLFLPEHPRAQKSGYVAEHIVAMEKSIGRPLDKGEIPHHRDFDRANNYPGNLILFRTKGMHIAYHRRLKAFDETGNYHWLKCRFCHQYDAPENLSIYGKNAVHRECANIDQRKRRSANG